MAPQIHPAPLNGYRELQTKQLEAEALKEHNDNLNSHKTQLETSTQRILQGQWHDGYQHNRECWLSCAH